MRSLWRSPDEGIGVLLRELSGKRLFPVFAYNSII